MDLRNLVKKLIPNAHAEGTPEVPFRMTPFGELFAMSDPDAIAANEGSYFVATNATPGTAVATTTSITAYDATKPVLSINNTSTVAQNKSILLRYIRLRTQQVPTSATDWFWTGEVDANSRYSSAGTAAGTPKSTNGLGTSLATILLGAVVLTAATAARRRIFQSIGRSVIPVINDDIIFDFTGKSFSAGSTLGGTVAVPIRIPCPPAIIMPQELFSLHGHGTSNAAAASWEYEIGYIER